MLDFSCSATISAGAETAVVFAAAPGLGHRHILER
jgi:hypothetical protein